MEKKKILIPADESLKELLENSFLHRDTFEFIMTDDGAEALRIIEEIDPTLVILDLDMPGLSGADCCREVKDDPFLADTPLALIATSSQSGNLDRCLSAGCDAVLTKPIDTQQLLGTICQLLDIELRGEPRVLVDLPARLRLGEGRLHEAQGIDLNHGGVFLHTLWLKPVETRLKLSLFLPGREGSLSCLVEVVWVNHPEWIKANRLPVGMGVQFIDPDETFKHAIDELYTSLLED